jgi:hypothetical protein
MFLSLPLAVLLRVPALQAEAPTALYLIENIVGAQGTASTENLVRISFDRDHKLVKETLLVNPRGLVGYFGSYQLVLNRFVVTSCGAVIDIPTRKVIHGEMRGEYLGLDGSKVVYRIPDPSPDSGIYAFDLKTHRVGKLDPPGHWALPGVKSPDKKMSVSGDIDWVVRLHRLGREPREMGKGFGFRYLDIAAPAGTGVPCLWLDNERILTLKTNSELVILSPQGAVEKFAEVKGAPAGVLSPPRLWTDPRGRVIYSCGAKEFLLDLRAKNASPLEKYALGHGFEASVAVDKKGRYTVYHEGKVIGQWIFYPFWAQTAPGLIAFAYVQPGEFPNLSDPEGVAVWSARAGDWRTAHLRVGKLVGWGK